MLFLNNSNPVISFPGLYTVRKITEKLDFSDFEGFAKAKPTCYTVLRVTKISRFF
jgi:hypothetical protein